MIDRETIGPGLAQLLAPVSAALPCGPSVRYDPAFLALRQAREEDDASLPMREWERPLRKADWRAVAQGSIDLLGKSKDALLAGWLTDAWTRQHQIAGFNTGADVLCGLVERYWDALHPVIEDGDADARVSAFVWMNENLPLTLRLQVPLMFLPDHKPAMLNLDDWEQVITPRPSRQRAKDEDVLTREQLVALAKDYKVYYKKVEGTSPTSYSMDHTAGNFIYDPSGKLRLFTRYGTKPELTAADIRQLFAG